MLFRSDINSIDSITETFELNGVMTLQWQDQRAAFDPLSEGVHEKIFQGTYQVSEVAASWFPQVVIMNDSGMDVRTGSQLRIRPDGTSTLTEKVTAVVEADLNMRKFPFDAHRLEAVFTVLGHDDNEVILKIHPGSISEPTTPMDVPGWSIDSVSQSVSETRDTAGGSVVLGISVAREASYIRRLITLPMFVIVLLSFSIFWMDKSSLSDRNAVSFLGVLTGVTFQQTVVTLVPPVSYITLMHAFLFISFFAMAATVPVNFAVSNMDRKGMTEAGDRIDLRCRWLFPLVYISLVLLVTGIALARNT